ncbi:TetR/AcrR family transcriptional regulator [Parafrankia sp. EUN1f]|uniref:TetR/AcrR family transcriptional regulator n=1 Tax=Parafrankia sp. EUN1f TaxID=102897 RepID=UPI0001C466F8|nr:TetR/AcrR family transcriptional regulator [Parafrankia sp. EUN1f]EFC86419.1 transcriptional regulator, TetR family [Parafrankia sp. EUN1f]
MTAPDGEALATARLPSLRTTPQQARGRAKLARMLAAADQIMATEGADAVTTTRLAAEAGISVGTVYRYLPHRGAVIEALAQHYLGLLEAQLEALIGAFEAGEWGRADLVGDAVDAFADFYRTHPGFRALWFGRHLTAETRELDRAHKQAMASRLAVLVAQVTGLDGDDLPRVSQVLQLATDAVIQEAFRADPNGDEELLRALKTMLRGHVAELRTGSGGRWSAHQPDHAG